MRPLLALSLTCFVGVIVTIKSSGAAKYEDAPQHFQVAYVALLVVGAAAAVASFYCWLADGGAR